MNWNQLGECHEKVPMNSEKATNVASAFVNVRFSRFGCQANTHNDNGCIIFQIFKCICKEFGIV